MTPSPNDKATSEVEEIIDKVTDVSERGMPKEIAVAKLNRLLLNGQIEELKKIDEIPAEVGKLANHSLKVSVYLEDRLKDLQQQLEEI